MRDWVKRNKLITFLILVILYLLWKQNQVYPLRTYSSLSPGYDSGMGVGGAAKMVSSSLLPIPQPEVAPVETPNRLVVQESSLSLVVRDVRDVGDKVIEKAQVVGGFMISSSLTKPEDAPYANISVRVPADKLKEVLDYYRKLAIKVSSENLYGYDVTDQYVDIQARLDTLNKTKGKFEEILRSATKVADLLEVNRQLISLQDQIDALKGQQKYLEQTAKLAKITLYLSTDELALPYAPSQTYRPAVVFKEAVRSLIATLRKVVTALIWLVVFIPVWLLLLLAYFLIKRILKKLNKIK